jgi:hypothetical protein
MEPKPEEEGGRATTPGTTRKNHSNEEIHDSLRFGKSDPRIERYIDFVMDEVLRLRGGPIGWHYWQKAFVAYAMGRLFLAWQAIHAACSWLAQVEWGPS